MKLRRAAELLSARTVTIPEAGEKLGLSRSDAYRRVTRREWPAVRVGEFFRIPLSVLEAELGR